MNNSPDSVIGHAIAFAELNLGPLSGRIQRSQFDHVSLCKQRFSVGRSACPCLWSYLKDTAPFGVHIPNVVGHRAKPEVPVARECHSPKFVHACFIVSNATTNVAGVQDLIPLRDRLAICDLPGDSVSMEKSPTRTTKANVASELADIPFARPASTDVLSDTRHEPLDKRVVCNVAILGISTGNAAEAVGASGAVVHARGAKEEARATLAVKLKRHRDLHSLGVTPRSVSAEPGLSVLSILP